jgi:hypothetical protein
LPRTLSGKRYLKEIEGLLKSLIKIFAVPCHLNKRLSNETGGIVPKAAKRIFTEAPSSRSCTNGGWMAVNFEFIG